MTGHFRATLLYHLIASLPLLTFAVVFIAAKLTRINRIRLPWTALTVGLVTCLIVAAVAYVFLPIILDDAESGVAGASIQAMRGLPVYPGPSAAARYGLVYGPIASLWHIPFYYLFGRNLASFKLAGVLAFLLTLLGLYRICRKYAEPRSSLLGLGCASVLLVQYIGYDFWGRSDPLIVFLLVVCTLVAIDGRGWAVVAVAAVTVGALPNLKISAAAYLLPILGFIFVQRGWKIVLASAGCGVCLIALPFALPQVSFGNYLFLLNVVKNQGINPDFLSRNIQYTLILLVPLLVLARYAGAASKPPPRPQLVYFSLIACAMAATCVLGAKIGAGNYHLLPYVVPILHLYFWRRSELPAPERDLAATRFTIPLVATLLLYSTTHLFDYLRSYEFAPRGAVAISEIRSVERTFEGRTVGVGVGDKWNDERFSYGPVSAFDGQPYTINFQSVRDTQLGGVDLPVATIKDIRDCGTSIWMIPKNQAPFAATNAYYESDHPGFDDAFRTAFAAHYQKVKSLAEFDVWMCGPTKK